MAEDVEIPLDTRTGPDSSIPVVADPEVGEDPGLAAFVEKNAPKPEPKPKPKKEPEPAAEPQPEVVEYEDGSTATIEHTSKGWRATLRSTAGGQPEVFYGETQTEMYRNVMSAKLHATQKIRELNRKRKLGIGREENPPVQRPTPQAKVLTADELFEINNLLKTDPTKALDMWYEKRTGKKPEQVAFEANAGLTAKEELEAETTARTFRAEHPDYIDYPENMDSLVAYLSKNKLGKNLNEKNKEKLLDELIRTGNWNNTNLDEAYDELMSDGLLDMTPVDSEETDPEVPEVKSEPKPDKPATDPRIAGTRSRTRAGYGISQREATTRTEEAEQPPSVEDLDNLSDEQLNELWGKTRKYKSQSGQRR